MKKQCKMQRHDVSGETSALCKKLGVSVRLYQAMEFWMFRQWLWRRMRDNIRWRAAGLRGKY